MNTATLMPADDIAGCPFFFDELEEIERTVPEEQYYKIYNDGGHYVALPYFHSYRKRDPELSPFERIFELYYNKALKRQRMRERCAGIESKPLDLDSFITQTIPILRARFPKIAVTADMLREMAERKRERLLSEPKQSRRTALDIAFDSLYKYAKKEGFNREKMTEFIRNGLTELSFSVPDLDSLISEKLDKKQRNFFAREKRLRRKGALNRWNYFITITYDDKKHDETSFRKKLRKCLSNLHTRRGWKYMGVFEEAPETGRLHFHALLYVPEGQLIGNIQELKDYSTRQGKVQTTHSNDFFADNFGRNDFEDIDMVQLRYGRALEYLLKYIEKSGERIVYSRGIPTQICKKIKVVDIVGRMKDFVEKFVLFDDVIDWEKDVLHYTKYKQITLIDILCNPPRTA